MKVNDLVFKIDLIRLGYSIACFKSLVIDHIRVHYYPSTPRYDKDISTLVKEQTMTYPLTKANGKLESKCGACADLIKWIGSMDLCSRPSQPSDKQGMMLGSETSRLRG